MSAPAPVERLAALLREAIESAELNFPNFSYEHTAAWLLARGVGFPEPAPAAALTVESLTSVLMELGVRRVNMEPRDGRFGKILSRETFAELLLPRLARAPQGAQPHVRHD